MVSLDDISASVYYTSPKGVHYIKLELFGMIINRITARPSINNPNGDLWIQMPTLFINGTWKKVIEFRSGNQTRNLIEDVCRTAVKEMLADEQRQNESKDTLPDEAMSDKELQEALEALPI